MSLRSRISVYSTELHKEVAEASNSDMRTEHSADLLFHGYGQRMDSKCRGEHCIRYHSSLFPENRDLSHAVASTYGLSADLRSRKAGRIFIRRSGPGRE